MKGNFQGASHPLQNPLQFQDARKQRYQWYFSSSYGYLQYCIKRTTIV